MKWLNMGCFAKISEEFSVFSLPYKQQVKYSSQAKRQNIIDCHRTSPWLTTRLVTFR